MRAPDALLRAADSRGIELHPPPTAKINLYDHEILIGKELGTGSFAHVFQGLWNETVVAIKAIEYKAGERERVDPLLEAVLSRYVPDRPLSTAQCLLPAMRLV